MPLVDTTGAPASITLTSGNNGVGFPSSVDFTIAAAANGLVSFDWDYVTFDIDGSFFDPFGYLLNGVFTQLTANGLFGPQSGNVLFALNTGDVFGFSQISTDSIFGPGVTTVSNFSAPSSVPEPASILLLGSGLAGLGLWRKKIFKMRG